jgi:hypothetical protein
VVGQQHLGQLWRSWPSTSELASHTIRHNRGETAATCHTLYQAGNLLPWALSCDLGDTACQVQPRHSTTSSKHHQVWASMQGVQDVRNAVLTSELSVRDLQVAAPP